MLLGLRRWFGRKPCRRYPPDAESGQLGQDVGGLFVIAGDNPRAVGRAEAIALGVEGRVMGGVSGGPGRIPCLLILLGEPLQEDERRLPRGVGGAERLYWQANDGQVLCLSLAPATQPGERGVVQIAIRAEQSRYTRPASAIPAIAPRERFRCRGSPCRCRSRIGRECWYSPSRRRACGHDSPAMACRSAARNGRDRRDLLARVSRRSRRLFSRCRRWSRTVGW